MFKITIPMPETVLALQDAQIYQRENLVLSNVNLKIEEGEFVYLIGKTGSGKSSLLKTLYADLFLEKGSVTKIRAALPSCISPYRACLRL